MRARRAPGAIRDRLVPYAFVGPLVAVFAMFFLWPALETLVSSLFRWGLLRPWEPLAPAEWDFVGLGNYTRMLGSSEFWNAVVNTGIWVVLFPLLVIAASLLFALLIWSVPRGAALFRTAFLLPMTISLTAVGVIWTFMYSPDFGVLPAALDAVGVRFTVEQGPLTVRTAGFLSNPGALELGPISIRFVNLSLVVAGFWGFTGFGVITLTAGLSGLPQDLVEAARVDGARTLQLVRHIIVPLLRRPLIVVGVVSLIFALRTFDIVWVITGGGPARDSEVLAVLLYKQAFEFLGSPQAGVATAVAVMMSVVLVAGAYRYIQRLAAEGRA